MVLTCIILTACASSNVIRTNDQSLVGSTIKVSSNLSITHQKSDAIKEANEDIKYLFDGVLQSDIDAAKLFISDYFAELPNEMTVKAKVDQNSIFKDLENSLHQKLQSNIEQVFKHKTQSAYNYAQIATKAEVKVTPISNTVANGVMAARKTWYVGRAWGESKGSLRLYFKIELIEHDNQVDIVYTINDIANSSPYVSFRQIAETYFYPEKLIALLDQTDIPTNLPNSPYYEHKKNAAHNASIILRTAKIREEKLKELKFAEQRKIEQKKYEEKRRLKLESIANWRTSIKVSDETNCGPIIDIKTGLIKVAFPVENYGNEHWVKLNQIYPANFPCRFVNGRYQAPNL